MSLSICRGLVLGLIADTKILECSSQSALRICRFLICGFCQLRIINIVHNPKLFESVGVELVGTGIFIEENPCIGDLWFKPGLLKGQLYICYPELRRSGEGSVASKRGRTFHRTIRRTDVW